MGITAIRRDHGDTPSLVRIETTDTLATVETPGYLTVEAPIIDFLNKGAFQWSITDSVLVYASDGVEIYEISSDFTSLIPITGGGASNTLQQVYDASPTGNIDLSPQKHLTLTAIDAAFATSAMTDAEFKAIPTPPTGLLAWNLDTAHFIVNKGSPGVPDYDELAFVDDFTTVDMQQVYDNSATGNINLATGKHITYTADDAAFALPYMTSGQFDAIPTPPNGLMAWASDADRIRVQKGAPGSPVYDEVAYVSDISGGLNDAVYGEAYFQGNATETPIVTQGVPVLVSGTYLNGDLLGFTQLNGVLTYTDAPTRPVDIKASLTSTLNLSTADVSFIIFHNGSPLAKSEMSPVLDGVTPSPKSVTVSCLLTISTGDTIALYVQNNDNTNDILVQDLNLSVTAIGGVGDDSGATLEEAYTNGDGTMTMTSGKPLEFQSADNGIVPTFILNQTQIPAASQLIGNRSVVSNNSSGTDITYSSEQTVVGSPTAGSDYSIVNKYARRAATNTLYQTYNGSTNTSQFPGLLTKGPANAGVCTTLAAVTVPTQNYPVATTLVWQSIAGTPTVLPFSFEIGDSIEFDCMGSINIAVPDVAVGSGIFFNVKMGSIINVNSSDLTPLSLPSNFTGAFQWKFRITRSSGSSGGQLNISGSGFFKDTNNAIKIITFPNALWTTAYADAGTYALEVNLTKGISATPGTIDYVCWGLNINQYS